MSEREIFRSFFIYGGMNEISNMQSIVNDNTIGSRGSVYNYCLAKRIEYIVLNGGLECFVFLQGIWHLFCLEIS